MSEVAGCMICGNKVAYVDWGKGVGRILLCLTHYSEKWVDCKKPTKCIKCKGLFIQDKAWQTKCYTCYTNDKGGNTN
jgi:hypothetical protein